MSRPRAWPGKGRRVATLLGASGAHCSKSARAVLHAPACGESAPASALDYVSDGNGGTITHKPEADYLDDGPQKPIRIWSRTGRRPLLAFGNSNGDIEMLEFARQKGKPSLPLLLLHDDAEREFDYVKGSERALARAGEDGWTVVSVKDDWTTVFG